MRKISLTMIFLTALFLNCNQKSQPQNSNTLDGEWDWAYTRGQENGESYDVSPVNMDLRVKYIFDRGKVIIFVNDEESERYNYYISGDTLRYGKEEVLFQANEDSLIMSNVYCCNDVFRKAFVQKVY